MNIFTSKHINIYIYISISQWIIRIFHREIKEEYDLGYYAIRRVLNWKSTWRGANFTRAERVPRRGSRNVSETDVRQAWVTYPTSGLLVLGSQHLRKGRLYKIRIASVNAQSNLVHGESVWLESETRLIEYAFRCQVADYKKKSWISFSFRDVKIRR